METKYNYFVTAKVSIQRSHCASQFHVIGFDYSPFRIKIHGNSYLANGTF